MYLLPCFHTAIYIRPSLYWILCISNLFLFFNFICIIMCISSTTCLYSQFCPPFVYGGFLFFTTRYICISIVTNVFTPFLFFCNRKPKGNLCLVVHVCTRFSLLFSLETDDDKVETFHE